MATKVQNQVKQAFMDEIGKPARYVQFDKVIAKKDGMLEFRKGYFYRHGRTVVTFAEAVEKALLELGYQVYLVHSMDNWQPWSKDSYFSVTFRVTEGQR